MSSATFNSIPHEPGRWWALTMAATVHIALFFLLWVGVRWQSETPVMIEAEVWGPQTQEAAPLPEPVRVLQPEPAPPVIEKPRPAEKETVIDKPDIALEQAKKRKEEEQAAKLAQKKEQERIEREKAAELAKKNKAIADAEKIAAEKLRLQEQADAAQRDKLRQAEMNRISGNTGSGGSGEAAKSQGGRADLGYVEKLRAKIKSNTTFVVPPDLRDNPSVEYTVELFPDGTVKNIKKERSSRLPGFDEAVERAISDSAPYPKDASGTPPSSFNFSHKPRKE